MNKKVKIVLIVLCVILLSIPLANFIREEVKKGTPYAGDTAEEYFAYLYNGEADAVIEDNGLYYVMGDDREGTFRVLIARKDDAGWHMDEELRSVSRWPKFQRVSQGDHSVNFTYSVYFSRKHNKEIVYVYKAGFPGDEQIVQTPPRDTLNSQFVPFYRVENVFPISDYYTIHDPAGADYEVFFE